MINHTSVDVIDLIALVAKRHNIQRTLYRSLL